MNPATGRRRGKATYPGVPDLAKDTFNALSKTWRTYSL